MNYILPTELREVILAYLKSNPYHEVADGVRALCRGCQRNIIDMAYKIDEQVVQALLAYLSQRPYAEVVQGIEALQKLEKLNE